MTANFNDLLGSFRTYVSGKRGGGPIEHFLAEIDWAMPVRPLEPHALPCLSYLRRLVNMASPSERELVSVLARHAEFLNWGQTYKPADFGQNFLENYGWVELFGTRGHFCNDRVAAGFLTLGPGIIYPDHHHIAEEVYIPLTSGTQWRMGDEPFRKKKGGEMIHHASNVSHAMQTGEAPLLALYLWCGGPLAQRSTIAAAKDAQGN